MDPEPERLPDEDEANSELAIEEVGVWPADHWLEASLPAFDIVDILGVIPPVSSLRFATGDSAGMRKGKDAPGLT